MSSSATIAQALYSKTWGSVDSRCGVAVGVGVVLEVREWRREGVGDGAGWGGKGLVLVWVVGWWVLRGMGRGGVTLFGGSGLVG